MLDNKEQEENAQNYQPDAGIFRQMLFRLPHRPQNPGIASIIGEKEDQRRRDTQPHLAGPELNMPEGRMVKIQEKKLNRRIGHNPQQDQQQFPPGAFPRGAVQLGFQILLILHGGRPS